MDVNDGKYQQKQLKSLNFSISIDQYDKLKKLKQQGFCKTMYILRLVAFYMANYDTTKIKTYKDFGFTVKQSKHYRVDLPIDIYNKLEEQKNSAKMSKSKLMRIGLNEILNFM